MVHRRQEDKHSSGTRFLGLLTAGFWGPLVVQPAISVSALMGKLALFLLSGPTLWVGYRTLSKFARTGVVLVGPVAVVAALLKFLLAGFVGSLVLPVAAFNGAREWARLEQYRRDWASAED